jgi:HK97 family phage major capsid protein
MSLYDQTVERLNAVAIQKPDAVGQVINGIIAESAVLSMAKRLADFSAQKENLPVLAGLPSSYFVTGDTGLIKTTKALWANKVITAEKIACIIPIAKDVMADSNYDLWAQIEPALRQSFGATIDGAALFGVNTPTSAPKGVVTQAIEAGNFVNIPALNPDMVEMLGGETGVMAKVEQYGFDVNGFVGDVGMKAKFRGLKDEMGHLIFQPSLQSGTPAVLYGQNIMYLKNGAFNVATGRLLAGDFNQLVYAFRQTLEFSISEDAVISDADGKVIQNLFQQDMVALKATLRLGWQTPNQISALNPLSSGCPFAVLRNTPST